MILTISQMFYVRVCDRKFFTMFAYFFEIMILKAIKTNRSDILAWQKIIKLEQEILDHIKINGHFYHTFWKFNWFLMTLKDFKFNFKVIEKTFCFFECNLSNLSICLLSKNLKKAFFDKRRYIYENSQIYFIPKIYKKCVWLV